jgi:hypothetical protein
MSFLEQEKKEAKQDNQIQLWLPIFKESDISFDKLFYLGIVNFNNIFNIPCLYCNT